MAYGVAYRPDIDGLRTVAVVPVVLFHAGMPGFGGGYVGVDIFFVISGYLITSILMSDIDRGTYSILRFYERRIRRIFPALAMMVLVSLAIGYVVLTPDEYASLGRSAVAVTVFVSNFHFWKSVDYFANVQAIHPLLHTWSLAVEEQFYILYPPVLAWLAMRHRSAVVPVLTTVAILSLALAATLVFRKPSATFYLPFTRAWELLAGALLFIRPLRPNASSRSRDLAGVAGLVLVLSPILLYGSSSVFPGLAAMPPVAGAALLIWSGTDGSHRVGRLLSTGAMTFVGRISYSLYLWHVPVFAYATYLTGGALDPQWATGCVALSFVLAWLSYHFIETPFRNAGRGLTRPATAGLAAMFAVLALSIGITKTGGMPTRLDARGAALVEAANDKQRFHAECMSNGNVIVPPTQACVLGSPNVLPTALL